MIVASKGIGLTDHNHKVASNLIVEGEPRLSSIFYTKRVHRRKNFTFHAGEKF